MNLFNMAQRHDPNLKLSSSVKTAKRKIDDVTYCGFDLSPSDSPQIIVKDILKFYPFCERTEVTGWLVKSLPSKLGKVMGKKSSASNTLTVKLQTRDGSVIGEKKIDLKGFLEPILLPFPFSHAITENDCDLVLELDKAKSGSAFLIVHRVLDRSEIIELCQGRGLELGPGTNPQILPNSKVDVNYLEQSSPEEWNKLYNDTGKYPVDPKLWSRYQIGEAYSLPVEDESLDFIFSSHVFEHLANPLGHLEHWYSKLRAGGMILGVVPDVAGCKDYVYRPCPLSDFIQEHEANLIEPNLEHYIRWAKYRAPGKDVNDFYQAKRSIHVHFYTNRNMSELLQYSVDKLGYSWFSLRHTANHKDFYFVLTKSENE